MQTGTPRKSLKRGLIAGGLPIRENSGVPHFRFKVQAKLFQNIPNPGNRFEWNGPSTDRFA